MYKLRLAIRYLFKRRIGYLAVAAVALCVFMVVVVMTVLNGLVTEFKDKNHSFTGDCVVSTSSLVGFPYYNEFIAQLEKADFVEAASPVIKSWALITPTGSEQNIGVEIMGVDPNRHCTVTDFGRFIYYHRDNCREAFVPRDAPGRTGIVVGIDMIYTGRDAFGRYIHGPVSPRLELAVSCFPLSAKGALTEYATGLVRTKIFYTSDDCHTGLAAPDTSYVYVPFNDLQYLCGMNTEPKRASAIYLKFKPGIGSARGLNRVQEVWKKFAAGYEKGPSSPLLATVRVQDWKDFSREVIAPLEKEQTMMTLLFCLVGIITVFIIFVIFYMIVAGKTKDIGILKNVGADNGDILQVFLGLAVMIGVSGAVAGGAAAIAFLANINHIEEFLFKHFGFQLWDRSLYSIEAIPNTLHFSVLAIIFLSTIAACLAGALMPALQAARHRPVETLRVNQI